ncbi:MAG TPA: hemolysin family protein [Acidimicrobiales bacterium]|nr:hemolysin family protein [Acidimicrobiales bacterium]
MIATAGWTGTDGILLGVVILLIVASAALALAETSLTRTSRAKAKALVDTEHRSARALQRLVEDPEGFLAPVLLLVLLSQLVAATLVGVIAAHLFGAWGVAAATAFEVMIIFVFGEAVPKQWAVRHPERAALMAAPVVTGIVAFPPVRWISRLLIGIARVITPGKERTGPSSELTESELLAFADVALEEEAIETDERTLIHQIIEFGDTIVREVMVPRPDVVAVGAEATAESVLERAISAGFSRIPVYEESIDDVVGIAFTKDLVRAVREGRGAAQVQEISRAAHYVPETKRVAPLLREMQRGQFHLAVVIDEYGGTAGVVTLEDLIEELVGEIVDEFDTNEPLVEPLGPGVFRVSGKMPVVEVNELLRADLPEDVDWDTIGGLVLAKAGHVPAAGETVSVGPYFLTVDRVVGRRIGAVRVERRVGEQLTFAADSAEASGAPVTKLP